MDRARRSSIGGHRGIHQSRLPRHAEQVVDRLVSRLEHACAFPHSGRVVPEVAREAVRELIESPYRLIYRVHDDAVEVLSILHSRRESAQLEES